MAELRLMVRMFRYVVPILLALYLYMLARSESQARALIRKELRKNLRSCHMCTLQLYPSAKLYSLQYMHSPEFVLIKNDHIICIYIIQCDHALLCPWSLSYVWSRRMACIACGMSVKLFRYLKLMKFILLYYPHAVKLHILLKCVVATHAEEHLKNEYIKIIHTHRYV
jgi:hypothetical protein